MLVKEYGLFWQRDEIIWHPGNGKKGQFRLLGRIGKNRPGLMVADFRFQQGVYVLYGNHGAHYVGLAEAERGLGERLKDHLSDDHYDAWDRFSWFGFRPVLVRRENGLRCLKETNLDGIKVGSPKSAIRDMEALLIKALGVRNKKDMNFQEARLWNQIKRDEVSLYEARH